MKIIERYPAGYRLLTGRGAWILLMPVRFVFAGLYRLWLAAGVRCIAARERTGLRERGAAGGGRPLVVSIGNLEMGGGGKTPCTLLIAGALAARGARPVVVSRGYRSLARKLAPCVVPSGRAIPAEGGSDFVTDEELLARVPAGGGASPHAARVLGDEILLYRSRGVPVVIDPDRGRGAAIARRLFSPTHILLDDAYQNRTIAKDVEILLLDGERPFGTGRLLPLGTLRESRSAVRRADVVLFTRAREGRVPREAERLVAGARVFFATHEPRDLVGRDGGSVPLSRLDACECVLFSGIARPESFERTALSLGARPRAAFRFIDHHEYTSGDIDAMLRAGGRGAAFVTTEKDWVKAAGLFPSEANVLALRIEMTIDGLDDLLDVISSSSS